MAHTLQPLLARPPGHLATRNEALQVPQAQRCSRDWHNTSRPSPVHLQPEHRCGRAYLPDEHRCGSAAPEEHLAGMHGHTDVLASDGRAMVLKYCASPLNTFELGALTAPHLY